jgi:hypothetical protein
MADRVVVTPHVISTPQKANVSTLHQYTFAACSADKNYAVYSEKLYLHAINSHATDPKTVTIDGLADEYGRTGSITAYSLTAGQYAVFGPFPSELFKQSNGTITFEGSSTDIKFAAIIVP